MSEHNYLQIEQGKIHWLYEQPEGASNSYIARPSLLFIHAGVSDHTLWDDQAAYFTNKGWGVLRYDIFGYGASNPSTEYLNSKPRPKVKHHEHAADVAKKCISTNATVSQHSETRNGSFVVIGLSRGGGIAIELAAAYPDLICGLVVVAGNLTGIDPPNKPEEDAQLAEWFHSMKAGETEKAAALFTHYWGDGPMEKENRMADNCRQKLYAWCLDITQREANGSGGAFSIPYDRPNPSPAENLADIRIPVATAMGKYDETGVNQGMRLLSEKLNAVSVKDFETAHMINLEEPQGFNAWVEDFLTRFII